MKYVHAAVLHVRNAEQQHALKNRFKVNYTLKFIFFQGNKYTNTFRGGKRCLKKIKAKNHLDGKAI